MWPRRANYEHLNVKKYCQAQPRTLGSEGCATLEPNQHCFFGAQTENLLRKQTVSEKITNILVSRKHHFGLSTVLDF